MKGRIIHILIVIFIPFLIIGQYNHQFIHFDNNGEALLDKVRIDYTPGVILDYNHARDTLFTILSENDSLAGIYTDMRLYLDPTEDPTQYVYNNGVANGINTEHLYPQSKGASQGNAKSDMHHLFPCRVKTNTDRGSLPFGEINDSNTERWYYKMTTKTSTPSQNKDLYSEWVNTTFEPRESVKGDVARAMFYFFTIYNDEAMVADPDFFSSQRATLCQWHNNDPIDSAEWHRSVIIGSYQEDLANPYVLDCSLAKRAFCPEIIETCYPNGLNDIDLKSVELGQNYPNPFYSTTTIPLNFLKPGNVEVSVRSVMGNKIYTVYKQSIGEENIELNIGKDLAKGIYFYDLKFTPLGSDHMEYKIMKMIKI